MDLQQTFYILGIATMLSWFLVLVIIVFVLWKIKTSVEQAKSRALKAVSAAFIVSRIKEFFKKRS